MAGFCCGLSRNKLLIGIMILIGIALILDAALRTFRNQTYLPFFLISIAGIATLLAIYWFKGTDW